MVVAFSPTEDMWSKEDVRELVKMILADTDSILYMVTTNSDSDFTDDVVAEIGIDTDNVFIVADNSALITKLTEEDVLVFLSDDQALNLEVNETIPLQLVKNDVSGCQAILINNILDQNKSQMKYYTHLDFWTKQIKKYW